MKKSFDSEKVVAARRAMAERLDQISETDTTVFREFLRTLRTIRAECGRNFHRQPNSLVQESKS